MTQITPNVDPTLDIREFSFRFKKDKLGNQRPTVNLSIAVPSIEGIVAILENGSDAARKLLLESVSDVVRSAAASIVGDTENISQDNFPFEKVTWEAIANQSRAERQTIAQEQWEAFAADYIATMPALTNKTVEQVTNATTVFLKKFSMVKTNKPVIQKLNEQLGLYIEHSKNAGNFSEILELLVGKADSLLKASEVEQLVQNL